MTKVKGTGLGMPGPGGGGPGIGVHSPAEARRPPRGQEVDGGLGCRRAQVLAVPAVDELAQEQFPELDLGVPAAVEVELLDLRPVEIAVLV